MCPPKELFLVVVTINPARAKRDTARMSKATRTSNRVKPLDLFNAFKVTPPTID
jgi:hypothetical protein